MRNKYLWLGFAMTLFASLTLIEIGDAQPQGKKGPPFGKKGEPPRPVTSTQIIDRIMAFDKNNDGKVTIDELPERMQHLIALGDTNKDGALDRDEVSKLAASLESFAALTGNQGGGPKGPPKGDGFKGGPKGGPGKGVIGEAQRTLDDLNLTTTTRDKTDRVLRGQQDKLKKFDDLMRAELVLQMKDVLNEEDYRVFKSALDRPPGKKDFPGKKGPPDLERRIDQLQKELEDLRKSLKK